MRTRSKLVLTGLTAALLMALAVNSASANRLSVDNQFFKIIWSPLQFFGEGGAEATVECPVTLQGSFHSRTFPKIVGLLVGYVTSAAVGNAGCRGGTATVLTETLPWHVRYAGFSGRLPAIERIRLQLIGPRFNLNIEGTGNTLCLYGRAESIAAGEVLLSAGIAARLAADPAIRLPLVRTSGAFGFLCPPEGGFRNTGEVFLLLSTNTRIRVTLI